MTYYIYEKGGKLFAKNIRVKPRRMDYPRMEIENFEDVEMEWFREFKSLQEIATHPTGRLQRYFREVIILQEVLPVGAEFDFKVVKICQDDTKWFPSHCLYCGWVGSSEDMGGGFAIADTGDCTDPTCPCCNKSMGGEDIDNEVLVPCDEVLAKIVKALHIGLDKFINQGT